MIVTSGALVLVAIALLIGGLASSGLTLVWASIIVSLVSAVCLAIGVYQRRNDVPGDELDAPSTAPKSDEFDAVRTVTSAAVSTPSTASGAALGADDGSSAVKLTEAPAANTAAKRATSSTATKTVAKKAPAKKTAAATKAAPAAKKTATSKTAAKKVAPTKTPAKKTPATSAAKKTPAKSAAKAVATKAAVKKTAAKKTAVKKTAAKKTAVKKTAAKKSAR